MCALLPGLGTHSLTSPLPVALDRKRKIEARLFLRFFFVVYYSYHPCRLYCFNGSWITASTNVILRLHERETMFITRMWKPPHCALLVHCLTVVRMNSSLFFFSYGIRLTVCNQRSNSGGLNIRPVAVLNAIVLWFLMVFHATFSFHPSAIIYFFFTVVCVWIC